MIANGDQPSQKIEHKKTRLAADKVYAKTEVWSGFKDSPLGTRYIIHPTPRGELINSR
jgi:hypothetical protein